jgi:type IV pili sensor histidine kinase/response regulator
MAAAALAQSVNVEPARLVGEPADLPRGEARLGRYTTVLAQPAEADAYPLAVIAQVHFPRAVVTTVGDAIRYLLIRTGYRIAGDEDLDASVKTLFGLPLPDNQRALGPYRVDAMLQVLAGTAHRLVPDAADRTVTYVPKTTDGPSGAAAPLAHNAPVVADPR